MVCCSFLLLHQAYIHTRARVEESKHTRTHEFHYKTIRSNLKLIEKKCDMRPYNMILFGCFFGTDRKNEIQNENYKIGQIATRFNDTHLLSFKRNKEMNPCVC